ncbi:putative bifunctional diguanylate cyclase/phosphodiesterase [Bradyrhizobium sp. SYSU BS000235]|uniref:putative bifunctional diguanylate cyclase/phosphodiesterase n=1 Tax=Bradyrhizobium sp. SYSU BS000235 TaxID=3411332 RepID=UPI003C740FB3
MLRLQNTILEMIARGETFRPTIERLCREIEQMLPGVRCSTATVERNNCIGTCIGPSLPEALNKGFEGTLVGPDVGSCGSAAYMRTPVFVQDIEHDPKFAPVKDFFLSLGVRACWSVPICDENGRAIAVLAFYFPEIRGPSARERRLMEIFHRLFVIAFERNERFVARERRAFVDSLTGLSNRAAFDAALSRVPNRGPGSWALLMIDLDNLKIINDTFGHQAGDALLESVAHRISQAMMPDVTFRLGGDEFAVIVQHQESLRDLAAAAERVLSAIAAPVDVSGQVIVPQATIGSAVFSVEDADAQAVQQNADFALYHAKETGRGGYVRYWPGIDSRISNRRTAINDLTSAIGDNRILAYYQPVVRIDSREIVGFEALCRLRTTSGAIVTAAAFQDATSDVRIAGALTNRMMSIVSADMRRWLDDGLSLQKVGVNVTTADLHAGDLLDKIAATFGQNDVPLSMITLEINESVYMGNHDRIVAREIQKLRDFGISISLDDFGTGYASLTHLKSIPANNIKVDRSFVADLAPGNSCMAIVEAIIGLAGKLGMRVVAEGIETLAQAALLEAAGCSLGQGFLYSKAVDRDTLAGLLSRHAQGIAGVVPMPVDDVATDRKPMVA